MKPHIEEALRALRLADRDMQAFNALCTNPDVHISIICFHAQQAVEKMLKAVLFSCRIEFERIHDLVKLAQLLNEQKIQPPVSEDQLRRLNPFAVTFRYDDLDIEIISLSDMANLLEDLRNWSTERVNLAARK
jgi:HEPN domain-containing protein